MHGQLVAWITLRAKVAGDLGLRQLGFTPCFTRHLTARVTTIRTLHLELRVTPHVALCATEGLFRWVAVWVPLLLQPHRKRQKVTVLRV